MIVIVTILAATALPTFTEFIRRGQLQASVEAVLNGVQLARSEAVRRNERVTFALGAAGTGVADAGDSAWLVRDSTNATIQQSRTSGEGGSEVVVTLTPAGASEVTFNGFGRVIQSVNGVPIPPQLSQLAFTLAGTQQTVRLEIENPGGQVRLCDPAIIAAGDPRRCLH